MKLMHGDCLELMKDIDAGSVDLVLCDLPYGVTACPWDSVLPLDVLWKEWGRVVKSNGIIVLFGTEPFSTTVRASNLKQYKYDWVWEKVSCSNPQLAKVQPLKTHENIMVFYSSDIMNDTTLFFERSKNYLIGEKRKAEADGYDMRQVLGNYMGSHYFTRKTQFAFPKREDYEKLQTTGYFKREYDEAKREYDEAKREYDEAKREYDEAKRVTYNPQGLKEVEDARPAKNGTTETEQLRHIRRKAGYVQEFTGYPKSIITFSRPANAVHPTQKPVALLEYLIRTYTNPGETVLDNCMGSGSTGVACVNTGREFIGIEKDDHYYGVACERIREAEGKAVATNTM